MTRVVSAGPICLSPHIWIARRALRNTGLASSRGGPVADTPKQSVFVSYSREDLVFATQLVLALRAVGFRVAIDHSELQGGEEWRDRLHLTANQ